MPRDTTDYTFEMFDLRKQLLDLVAECARNDTLGRAKLEGAYLIRRHAEGDAATRNKAANAFQTSLDRAIETVDGDGKYDIEIESFPADGILTADNHDAKIDPTREIDGDVTALLKSTKRESFTSETTIYPLIDHPSGFTVCTCGAQKYYLVCTHTLARVVERNWARATVTA